VLPWQPIYESHYSGYFVGREFLPSTIMQVAMVMALQFVMMQARRLVVKWGGAFHGKVDLLQ